ncbi:EpsG family protein [Photobacterium profundum]|uniref:EpsG family protein n=1 Tax=Photobacterium profundum TaxID=74109 RepID=UPI003D1093F4
MIVPLVLFGTFRGTSGPDTINYINRFFNVADFSWSSLDLVSEPILTIIMLVSALFSKTNYEVFFFFFSIVILVPFVRICEKYHQYRFFLITVGAVLIIDGLTNTLRVSLAYFFFVYFYTTRFFFLGLLLSFLSHVSSLLMYFFGYLFKHINLKFDVVSIIKMLAFVFILFVFVVNQNYLFSFFPRVSEKLDIYQTLKTTSSLSGVSDLFVIFSLLCVASVYNRDKLTDVLFDVISSALICIVLYQGISVSLGFLRVLKLIIIALTLSPMLTYSKRYIPTYLLLAIGIPYLLNYIRIISSGDSYLPYGLPFY